MNASRRIAALLCLVLAACVASPNPSGASTAPAVSVKVADSDVAPAPKPTVDATSQRVGVQCDSDSDCLVKDVGSCCGYFPRCVNKDSPTYPEQVKAQCAKEGRASICGFPAISGCQCVAHECVNVNAGATSAAPVR